MISVERAKGLRYHKYKKQNFEGVEKIPVYKKYIYHLRPWDATPSPVYVEDMQKRRYWYTHHPSLRKVLGILLGLFLAHFVVAALPLLCNLRMVRLTWEGIEKPAWTYNQGYLLAATWTVSHLLNSMAVWFVYLDGGFDKQKLVISLYSTILLLEVIWADVFFSAGHIFYTLLLWVGMVVIDLLSIVLFWRVAILAGVFLLPSLANYIYGCVVLISLMSLNGGTFVVQIY